MQDHTALWDNLRDSVTDLRSEVRVEFAAVRADMSRRLEDVRAEIGQVRVDLHRLDDKVDRHFVWLAGTLVTSVLVMMGAIIGLYFK